LPQNSDSIDDSLRFSASAVKKALQSLTSQIGLAYVDLIIYHFERIGMPLDIEHATYSLNQIQQALEDVFGAEAGALLVTQLVKQLFKE
jgi:diketogulonate reductase-like aldo/keto reductase